MVPDITTVDGHGHGNGLSPELHGRRVILTGEREITRDNVLTVLAKAMATHLRNRAEIVYLERYLRGWQPILNRVKTVNAEINNKVVVNLANEIVTFKASEFAGKPIQYVSRGSNKSAPKKVSRLNDMMLTEEKQSKDLLLAYQMFTCGVGYRLVIHDPIPNRELYDEAPFEISIPDPKNTFIVRLNDVSKRPVMGVTYVYTDENGTGVEYTVYTPNVTYTIAGVGTSGLEIVNEVRHNFGLISLVEYPCNPVRMGAFEVVLPLLDAINLTQSNRLDGIEQFIQAIMVFEGVDITREQFLELKDLGALKLPPAMDGRTSKVYYLNEELNQSQTQTLVDDMYETVLEIVGIPSQSNGGTSDSSNNGAVIMKNGWWHAEARSLETQSMWIASETETLKIVMRICRDTKELIGLKVAEVEPKFWRQSYEDTLVKTQAFASLRGAGMPSIQAFTFSNLSKDPESDALVYDKYQEEQAQQLDAEAGVDTNVSIDEEEGVGADNVGSTTTEGTGHPKAETGICPVCGRSFKKKTNNQIFDRPQCRNKARRHGAGQDKGEGVGDID